MGGIISSSGFLVNCQMRGQELQGYDTFQFGVLGFVDDTHTTLADLFEDYGVGYGFANPDSIDNFIIFYKLIDSKVVSNYLIILPILDQRIF